VHALQEALQINQKILGKEHRETALAFGAAIAPAFGAASPAKVQSHSLKAVLVVRIIEPRS
jgi:hypothetical protein